MRPAQVLTGHSGGRVQKGLPDDISRSSLLTQEDLEYYASRFRKTGFAPGLNWYRNISRNWVEAAEYHERKAGRGQLATAGTAKC